MSLQFLTFKAYDSHDGTLKDTHLGLYNGRLVAVAPRLQLIQWLEHKSSVHSVNLVDMTESPPEIKRTSVFTLSGLELQELYKTGMSRGVTLFVGNYQEAQLPSTPDALKALRQLVFELDTVCPSSRHGIGREALPAAAAIVARFGFDDEAIPGCELPRWAHEFRHVEASAEAQLKRLQAHLKSGPTEAGAGGCVFSPEGHSIRLMPGQTAILNLGDPSGIDLTPRLPGQPVITSDWTCMTPCRGFPCRADACHCVADRLYEIYTQKWRPLGASAGWADQGTADACMCGERPPVGQQLGPGDKLVKVCELCGKSGQPLVPL